MYDTTQKNELNLEQNNRIAGCHTVMGSFEMESSKGHRYCLATAVTLSQALIDEAALASLPTPTPQTSFALLCRPDKEAKELMVLLTAHEVAQGRWVVLDGRQHHICSPQL